jgi:hypothetical protein
MKRLLFIFIILISGCGTKEVSTYNPLNDSDSIYIDEYEFYLNPKDSIIYSGNIFYEEPKSIILFDSLDNEINHQIQMDSLIFDKTRQSDFIITKLDTVSILEDLQNNIKVLEAQQKLMDSLLQKD